MKIDEQTLGDLEVFRADGGTSLFQLIDRTVTRGGRSVLKQRLRSPMRERERILETHAALRFLIEHRNALLTLPTDAIIDPVLRYLDSPYVTTDGLNGPSAASRAWWIALRHKDLVAEIRGGVGAVRRLHADASGVSERLRGLELPAHMQPLVDRLETALADLAVCADPKHSASARLLLHLDNRLRTELRSRIHEVLECVHELDALRSMADATSQCGFILPEVESGPSFVEGAGIRHPLLSRAVENDVCVRAGDVAFLTGPNMAGKSTYLRSCGVCVYLAHVGMGVPAKTFRIAPYDALFTAIRIADSLRDGTSFFQAEVRRVKEIATAVAAGDAAFVIVDEMFKGTNVTDASEATFRVVSSLAGAGRGAYLVSSHLIELAVLLHAEPAISFQHFAATFDGGRPKFDYRLKPGTSDQRLGLTILEQDGVFAILDEVRAARSV